MLMSANQSKTMNEIDNNIECLRDGSLRPSELKSMLAAPSPHAKMNHSLTPWRVYPDNYGTNTKQNYICLLYSDPVAPRKLDEPLALITKGAHATATPEQLANAAFIVHAVNNHEALLQALKELLEAGSHAETMRATSCGQELRDATERFSEAYMLAKSVIAAAEGKA